MAKLTLNANPTFKAKVGIPLPGSEEAAEVEFTFKHRTRDELDKWMAEPAEDLQKVLEMATGWDLPDKFTEPNVKKLLQNYFGAAGAIVTGYLAELMKAKTGN
jgi:hypothetical protein